MKISSWQKVRKRWIRELIFFGGFFVLMSLSSWNLLSSVDDFINAIVYFLILYSQAIFYRVYIFPLLIANQTRKFIFLTVISLLAGGVILYATEYFWLDPEFYRRREWITMGIISIATCVVSLIAMMSIFLIEHFYRQQEKHNQQQLLLSEAQNKLLQAQLNPHFLFNTLNNLYGTSIQQPGRLPEMIMQLSKLMRYQVESIHRPWVKLTDEVDYLGSYIELETERIGKRCSVKYQYPRQNQFLSQYQIAPLLLMPLIENAFKHGTAAINASFVNIHIDLVDNLLTLDILNSISDPKPTLPSTGTGIPNTQKRLEMFYQGQYHLSLTENHREFKTRLMLYLTHYRDAGN